MTDRVIVLVDMDCFYCQVETRLNPKLDGLPMAVVQYNLWKGGGIIAVNYEARDRGVTRHMRGEEAKKHCPEIVLVTVPTLRDKADLTRYRDAGREVVSVLCTFSDVVQRASVDEAYLDITAVVDERLKKMTDNVDIKQLPNTFVVGYSNQKSNDEKERCLGTKNWLRDIFGNDFQDVPSQKLAMGAVIVEEMRHAVYETTGFRCSAGIAHNKILAKLACGIHKPNRQTVLPQSGVAELYQTLSVKKIRSLGGKLGDELIERLGCKHMADLLKFSEQELKEKFEEKTGSWLYNIARGFDYEAVEARLVSKSIGCCKKFPGKNALANRKDVDHWLGKLAEELLERLLEDEAMYKRRAQQMVVSMHLDINKKEIASSKSIALPSYNYDKIVALAMSCLKKSTNEDPVTLNWSPSIKYLGLSCGKFSEKGIKTINTFFKVSDPTKTPETPKPKPVTNVIEGTSETSFLDETGGSPSFFEKIFLKDCGKINGQAPKLNLIPNIKNNSLDNDDSQSSWTDRSDLVEKVDIKPENEDSSSGSKKMKINDFFSKNSVGENSCAKNNNVPKYKEKSARKSISTFFKDEKLAPALDPEEIFPDLSCIDDDTLSLFPPSFKKRVLELRNQKLKEIAASSSLNENGKTETNKIDVQDINSKNNENVFADNSEMEKENNSGFRLMNPDSEEDIFDEKPSVGKSNSQPFTDVDVQINEDEDMKICSQCFQSISVFEYEEHTDYHFAMNLQKEFNSTPNPRPIVSNTNKVSPKKSLQNKRKNKSNDGKSSKNQSNKKVRGIDTFFKR